MAVETEPLLRLHGVTKRFGDRIALGGVDLAVHRRRLLAVSGPSGSGKTTLLNLLLGWELPDAGSIHRAAAVSPGADGVVPWRAVAVVPQQRGLLTDLSLLENVRLPGRLTGEVDGGDARDLLEALGLGPLADRLPDEVSLGEQQRTSVARALVVRPALLLADEPTAHQDAASARLVVDALRAAADAGSACVVVTHDPEVVAHADEVVQAGAGADKWKAVAGGRS